MDKRPGPNARVVGRGRISAVPIWALILLIGVSGIVLGGTAMALIIGVPFTLVALLGFAVLLRSARPAVLVVARVRPARPADGKRSITACQGKGP